MRQDPFDQMRRNNPLPSDQMPAAPMGVADRIIGSSASWPGWVVAAAAAVVVVAIGGGTLLLVNRSAPTVVAADTSTSLPPVASSSPDTTTTSSPSVTTLSTDTTVTTPSSSVTLPPVVTPTPAGSDEVVVYFLVDDPTATEFSSQSLIPVVRSTAILSSRPLDLQRTALGFLLAGPTPGEADSVPAFTTAVPSQTVLLGLDVEDRVATVDLSAEFFAGSGTFSEIARLEQLTYTLTRFEDIDGIRLLAEGVLVEVFGSHGLELDDPVVRTEFDTLLPAILIETPAHGTTVGNPLAATGTANVFEASVSLTLVDGNGLIIWEGFTTATCGTGCRGEWAIEIPYEVDAPQMGAIIAWEESARDGSQVNVREHPVWLVPADDGVASAGDVNAPSECSGSLVTDLLVEQPDLPADAASMRAAIFAAAVACDWEAMRSLLAEDFMFSFGGLGDAVAYWQELELFDEQPMRYLAGLLNRPSAVQVVSDVDYHVWPSAFVIEWTAVPDADREALRPLYGDDDFAMFSDFGGYFGYRVGIVDGTWVYFIAGD